MRAATRSTVSTSSLSRWLTLMALATALAFSGCSDDDDPSKPGGERTDVLEINPSSAVLGAGETRDFDARATGEDNISAQWSLVQDGDVGQIDTDGLYTAPDVIGAQFTVTVRAEAPDLFDQPAFAEITLVP